MEYIPHSIIVHHSAADTPDPQFEAINEWHKARNFSKSSKGYYVGYHAVIEKDGTIVRARYDTERDCDTLGHNFDSLSVCLVGNFDISRPTDRQIDSLGWVLSEWCRKWELGAINIFPHRKFAQKSCYGSNLQDNWAAVVYLKYEIERLQNALAVIENKA